MNDHLITFTKLRDGSWGVRGPVDEIAPGAEVLVTKRSGETSTEVVATVVWENAEIAIASLAPRPRVEREQAPAAPAVEVPAGYFAVRLGGKNEVEFFRIDKPDQGKWAGWTFVKQQASDDWFPVKGARKDAVLAAVAVDPLAAMALYGQEIGSCGRCNRTLTDDISRDMGIGPDCADILGIERPSRASYPLSTEHGEAADHARTAPVVVTQQHDLPGTLWEDIFKG